MLPITLSLTAAALTRATPTSTGCCSMAFFVSSEFVSHRQNDNADADAGDDDDDDDNGGRWLLLFGDESNRIISSHMPVA